MADFADFDLGRSFGLVYVVFDTFFGLLDQERQISCFRAVARHLGADGVFAMEAFVPNHARFDRGQRVSAIRVEPDEVHIEVTKHDPLAQTSDSQHLIIRDDRVPTVPGEDPVRDGSRARPDGELAGFGSGNVMGRLGSFALRLAQRQAHLGLGTRRGSPGRIRTG